MLRFVGGMVWFSRKHAPRNTSLRVFSSSQHHRHAVGGEADGLGDIEIVDGLHEADAAHLKEIVGALAPACEALDDGQHQAEVAADELLAGVLIAVLGTAEKGHHFIVFQNGQLRRVDAAYLHPAAHNATCLLC